MHIEVIESVILYAGSLGFEICGLDFSPIRGPEGNIEYLLYVKNGDAVLEVLSEEMREQIRAVVEDAHQNTVKHAEDL